jgi:predicted transposase YdaD
MFELDRTMKILAARYPQIFQQILFGTNPDIQFLGVEDTAINVPEQRSDKIFRFRKGKTETIISFEFMARPELKQLQNFHVKNGLLTGSLRQPVATVIVYLERGRYRNFPDEYSVRLDGVLTVNRFTRVLLWEYAERIRNGELKELAPLLVLFSERPSTDIVFEEKKLINEVKDVRERADLLALAAMVAFRKFRRNLVEQLFYKEYEMLKESNFIQEWVKEGWEKGREEGREEGWEKGREEGWREGRITTILTLLEQVLGRVSSELEQKIRRLSDGEIKKLTKDLLDMKKVSDLEEWLEIQDKNNQEN